MKVAILNFDAILGLYQDTLLFFARALEVDHSVTILGCTKALKRCTSFTSFGKPVTDQAIEEYRGSLCDTCVQNQRKLVSGALLSVDSELDGLNARQEEILSKLARERKARDSSEVLAVQYEGCPIGRLAYFDFSLLNKVSDRSILTDSQYADLLEFLRDAFRVWNFVGRALRQEKFDAALYVNGNYSLNSVARARLVAAGVRCWSVEYTWGHSVPEKRIYLEENRLELSPRWKTIDDLRESYRCQLRDTRPVLDALRLRVKGVDFNSYSSSARTEFWDVFDRFRAKFRFLVSIYLSSSDELTSHVVGHGMVPDASLFKSQEEWLEFILANASPDVGYVVRLHPRFKANKRDSVQASEYATISAILEKAKDRPNILVVEPDAQISSYYIVLKSDLTVVAWSTVGLESLLLGVPTVMCFPGNVMYPIGEFSPQPGTRDEFKAQLAGRNIPKLDRTGDLALLKWLNLAYFAMGLQIPGARHAGSFSEKARARLQRLALSSRLLYGILYKGQYRRKVGVTRDGAIRLELGDARASTDEASQSLSELERFRAETRGAFGSAHGQTRAECVET